MISLTPSFTQPEAAFAWQRQHGFDSCQICCLRSHQAVSLSAGWMDFFLIEIISSDSAKVQTISIFPQNFILILSCHNAEKYDNTIPGDLSTVHAGEKRVQTMQWM